jgi:integrase
MRAACLGARIKPAVGFHQLRHTWASLAVMRGMHLSLVARNLGHRSTAMVERHYGHLADSYIDEGIRQHAPRYGVTQPTNVRPLRGSR